MRNGTDQPLPQERPPVGAIGFETLAQVLAEVPGHVARLLSTHQPGPDGWCAGCGPAGSAHRTRYPCGPSSLARRAAEIRDAR